jgi:multisubunit Na+/H+ antiporter MnhB subunit
LLGVTLATAEEATRGSLTGIAICGTVIVLYILFMGLAPRFAGNRKRFLWLLFAWIALTAAMVVLGFLILPLKFAGGALSTA